MRPANNVTGTLDFQSSIVYYGALLYLFSFVIEGPLRYILYSYDVVYLIYLRDGLLFSIIMVSVLKSLVLNRSYNIILYLFFILLFHTFIAYFYVRNILAICFGLKVFFPLLLGILVYNQFFEPINRTKKILSILFIIAVLGVLINHFYEYPWTGLTYQVGGYQVEGVLKWHEFGGIPRIAGFSRASYEAAIQIILLGIFLVTHIKTNLFKLFIWIITGMAILLTLTKAIIITYFIITLFFIITYIVPNYFKIYQKILIIFIGMAILLPCLGNYIDTKEILMKFTILSYSLIERIKHTWPLAFELIQEKGSLVLGRGPGGIGMGQRLFEERLFNPADNIFLYAYGYFGVLSIFYFLYIYYKIQNIDVKKERYFYLICLSTFCYGIVQNIFESAMFSFFIGLFLMHIHNQEKRNLYLSYAS